MEDSTQVIRHQMAETRASLQEKLETLEQQVVGSVQGAAASVTETVQTVKDAVEETVETVKGTVKDSLDVRRHVEEHPWAMVLGSVAVGYVGGCLLDRAMAETAAVPPGYSDGTVPTGGPRGNGFAQAAAAPAARRTSWWSDFATQYGDELAQLKSLAVGTMLGIARDMLAASAPPQVGQQLADVVDGFTTKLGATPIKGPVLGPDSPRRT